jgi:hypothetical protein
MDESLWFLFSASQGSLFIERHNLSAASQLASASNIFKKVYFWSTAIAGCRLIGSICYRFYPRSFFSGLAGRASFPLRFRIRGSDPKARPENAPLNRAQIVN